MPLCKCQVKLTACSVNYLDERIFPDPLFIGEDAAGLLRSGRAHEPVVDRQLRRTKILRLLAPSSSELALIILHSARQLQRAGFDTYVKRT
jgi:hypothetical protein